MRWLWIAVVLCFLSLYARADAVVTLDFSDFKVDSVPPEQFQPIGFGDYFTGATVPDAFGNPITGPELRALQCPFHGPVCGSRCIPRQRDAGVERQQSPCIRLLDSPA